jgi:hypothetical protein
MILASRKWVLAAGAAALLSTQAAWAVPVNSTPAVDPLVSLSILGSQQSRTAVCGTGATCALPAGMSAATAATSPAIAGSAAAVQGPGHPYGLDWAGLAVLFAFPVVLILAMALEDNGNDTPPFIPPISPP